MKVTAFCGLKGIFNCTIALTLLTQIISCGVQLNRKGKGKKKSSEGGEGDVVKIKFLCCSFYKNYPNGTR